MSTEQTSDSNTSKQIPESVGCVWILASAPTWSTSTILSRLPRPDRVIAADGGTALAAKLGLVPDLVVGDIDSAAPFMVAEIEAAGIEVRRYEHNTKWETDTELAVLASLEWQPHTIVLLGAYGGRIDHSLANILLLTHPQLAAVNMRIVDGKHEIFLAKPGEWNRLGASEGDTVTLLPLGGDVHGVRTNGLLFPLNNEVLLPGRGRGVSNQAIGAEASVWLDSGQLLLVVLHAGQE